MQDRDWNTADTQSDTAQAVLDAPRDLAGLVEATAWDGAPTAKFEDDLDDLDGDDPFAPEDDEDDDLDLDDDEDDDDDDLDDFDDDDDDDLDGFDDEDEDI